MNGTAEFGTDLRMTGGEAVVFVAGEIDLETSPVLRLTLLEALASRPRRLAIDFTRVTFCDCSGLNTLLRARTAARKAGTSFALLHVEAQAVRHLLDLTEAGPLLGLDVSQGHNRPARAARGTTLSPGANGSSEARTAHRPSRTGR
ncbi:STAS domain-containing protein [Streptomyces sp. NPDC090054]|uniref:STAS domain-containing protein n=1 Tax=Streptomyces sp. NPDC090054 TaxID=3365933 RepID=UPI0037F53CB8